MYIIVHGRENDPNAGGGRLVTEQKLYFNKDTAKALEFKEKLTNV